MSLHHIGARLTSRRARAELGLAVVLLVAASLHFLLIGEHALESPVLGLGFLMAAVIQLVQASIVLVHHSRALLRSVIVLNVLLIGLYLAHVLIGLPLPSGPGGSLVQSPPERVDPPGVVTVAAELTAVLLSYRLLFDALSPATTRASISGTRPEH